MEGVYVGLVGGVYLEGCLQWQTGINPGCSRTGLGRKGEEGQDKRVRTQDKILQQERRPHLHWKSAMVSGGQPA